MNRQRWQWREEVAGIEVRPLCIDDAARVYETVQASVVSVGRWMDWCHPGYTLAMAELWLQSCKTQWATAYGDREFGIFDVRTGVLLGCVGINQINQVNRFGNLGYWVRPTHTGRGVATAAARCVARFGLEDMGLVRVEIVVRKANAASRRVAEKLGATFEGMARARLMFGDTAHDAAVYSLVRDDLKD